MTSNTYSFQASAQCNSDALTISVTNLPNFMIHNKASSDFTINRVDNTNLIGTYTVSITCSLQVIDDPFLNTFSEISHEYDFTVEVLDPCEASEIVDFKVNDMHRFVGQSPIAQSLPVVQDTVSQSYGSMDGETFCGERKYEVVEELPVFLEFDQVEKKLTLTPGSESESGEYTLTLKAYLYFFPQVQMSKTFKVVIEQCEITVVIEADDISYTLGG